MGICWIFSWCFSFMHAFNCLVQLLFCFCLTVVCIVTHCVLVSAGSKTFYQFSYLFLCIVHIFCAVVQDLLFGFCLVVSFMVSIMLPDYECWQFYDCDKFLVLLKICLSSYGTGSRDRNRNLTASERHSVWYVSCVAWYVISQVLSLVE